MDLNEYRRELIDAALQRISGIATPDRVNEGLLYEFVERLTQAEEFSDVIPCHFSGTGSRGRRLRVDGYQLDEADDSIRLIVCDFSAEDDPDRLTRTRAEASFRQVQTFIEDSRSGRIWSESGAAESDAAELASMIESLAGSVSRYRIYLLTDSQMSGTIKELPETEIEGVPTEYHIWDVSRLAAVSYSALGIEEFEVDFTEFVEDGLACLKASSTDEYQGYLAVIPGDVLARVYDRYGSKLLEGNVRSFLTARGKVNKSIQGTIRAEPEKFFVYNNGITCTATEARLVDDESGTRLLAAKYLQIVNGGQTTASLHAALRLGQQRLDKIHVQMKLSVVTVEEAESLEGMIEKIARYSNSQNKVSDADFFSNHPYHQAMERLSRRIPAPAVLGAQYHTRWFYERARGQYQNAQLHLTPAKKREFLRENPRAQMLSKTDVAKFENSWMGKPHIVSQGAQKNFSNFASFVARKWGEDGSSLNNEGYFRDVVARTILFKRVEQLVSSASWYQTGLPRAQIVTYTIAKLANVINDNENGGSLDFKIIWNSQALTPDLEAFLLELAAQVYEVIGYPPVQGMHVGEWSKKEICWQKVKELPVSFPPRLQSILVGKEVLLANERENFVAGKENTKIDALSTVISLGVRYWQELADWARQCSPIYGKEADLVRLASRHGWIPSDKQAAVLMSIRARMEREGFRADS